MNAAKFPRTPEDEVRIAEAAASLAGKPGATADSLAAMLARCDQKEWVPVSMEFNLTLSEWKNAMQAAASMAG